MRTPLSDLQGREFDVAIIGAGVNGASAAQHLAAAGYSVLIVDKGDYASGASGRSSRNQHCGLRYLASGRSMWDMLLHPSRLADGLRMARLAMQARGQMVRTAPSRLFPMKCHFPIYEGGAYAKWQVSAAFRILSALGPKDIAFEYQIADNAGARKIPMVRDLRNLDGMRGVANYTEYQLDWPDRICVDTILDAIHNGTTARNYTEVEKLDRRGKVWQLALRDRIGGNDSVFVNAKMVLNTAGIWIDEVNAKAVAKPTRRTTWRKGSHILVKLPPECEGHAVATLSSVGEPFYCFPWRDLHYFGPTDTIYDGDPNDIRSTPDEIEFILAEANYMFPSYKFRSSDVLYTWAGARPLTFDSSLPNGNRTATLHDLAADGMPDVLAYTAGPILSHRIAGKELTSAVQHRLQPSTTKKPINYSPRKQNTDSSSPRVLQELEVRLSDLRRIAGEEHVTNLVDLLVRRTAAAYTKTMAYDEAETVANAISDIVGWDSARVQEEVANYRRYLSHTYGFAR